MLNLKHFAFAARSVVTNTLSPSNLGVRQAADDRRRPLALFLAEKNKIITAFYTVIFPLIEC